MQRWKWKKDLKLRWKRRNILLRSIKSRNQLQSSVDRTKEIGREDILCMSTVRNEMLRLPYFLKHHRNLGVSHFFFVDNGSQDGTHEFLCEQSDCSVWKTSHSYKLSRFGMDWLGWLQFRYSHRHWCLTLDADELLIFPDMENQNLNDLTNWLNSQNVSTFGAMMLDMYPKGRLSEKSHDPDRSPAESLAWFDAFNYTWEHQEKYQNISIRGGVRKRYFFADTPDLAPHLHKIPLVRWNRRYTYVSSTHIALPNHLNLAFDDRQNLPTGVLLHSKFLNNILEKSAEEKDRREHFTHAGNYDTYYDDLISDPNFWTENSVRYQDWTTLLDAGLLKGGGWWPKTHNNK